MLQEICARLYHQSHTIASADKKRSELCVGRGMPASLYSNEASSGEAPVLPYLDSSLPYILETDASQEGVGAVLSQLKDGQEYVVAYYSSKFSKGARNCHSQGAGCHHEGTLPLPSLPIRGTVCHQYRPCCSEIVKDFKSHKLSC